LEDFDFLSDHLGDLPPVVDARLLAEKCGCSIDSIYQRSRRSRAEGRPELLPSPLIIPGANGLIFTRAAVVEWFRSAVPSVSRKPGRPKGALSRRGLGRAELEARLAEDRK
jgi:hypothetical protein